MVIKTYQEQIHHSYPNHHLIKFEGVIFDMDGLLLDTEKIALDMFNEALKSFDLDEENELFISLIGTNSKTSKLLLKEGLAGKVDTKEFGKVWTQLYRAPLN